MSKLQQATLALLYRLFITVTILLPLLFTACGGEDLEIQNERNEGERSFLRQHMSAIQRTPDGAGIQIVATGNGISYTDKEPGNDWRNLQSSTVFTLRPGWSMVFPDQHYLSIYKVVRAESNKTVFDYITYNSPPGGPRSIDHGTFEIAYTRTTPEPYSPPAPASHSVPLKEWRN